MKPHRIRMAHNLLLNYGLYRKMEIYRPSSASFEELCKFHSEDYVRFLRTITPSNMGEHTKQMQRFNVGEDCPSSTASTSSTRPRPAGRSAAP